MKKTLTIQLEEKDYNQLFKNADRIGIAGATYGRNILQEELKSKAILTRMTGGKPKTA